MVTKRQVTTREEVEHLDGTKHKHQNVSNGLKLKLDHLKTFEPLTENQRLFFELYKGGAYFMGLFGSPGVGKTFLAMYKAIEEVLDKTNSFKQIVVVRSLVQLREIGHLPGTLEEKQERFRISQPICCHSKQNLSTNFGNQSKKKERVGIWTNYDLFDN